MAIEREIKLAIAPDAAASWMIAVWQACMPRASKGRL